MIYPGPASLSWVEMTRLRFVDLVWLCFSYLPLRYVAILLSCYAITVTFLVEIYMFLYHIAFPLCNTSFVVGMIRLGNNTEVRGFGVGLAGQ